MFKSTFLLCLFTLTMGWTPIKANASESASVGVTGDTRFSRSCGPSQRMTGLQLSASLDRLSVQCTPYAEDGAWASTQHSYTAPTNPGPTLPGKITFIGNLTCPEDTWVGGIEGRSAFLRGGGGLRSITLNCFRGDVNGNMTGNATPVTWRDSETGRLTSGLCPNNEIAYGVSGGRRGERISNLRLKCKTVLSVPSTAPAPLRPGSNVTREIQPGVREFHFRPVNGATHYRIRILSDSSSPRKWFDQLFGGRLLFANGGNERYVKIRIPSSRAGTLAKWKASACNRQRQCGPWSQWRRFSVIP